MSESIKPSIEDRMAALETEMAELMGWMKECSAKIVGSDLWNQKFDSYKTKGQQLDDLHEEFQQQRFNNSIT